MRHAADMVGGSVAAVSGRLAVSVSVCEVYNGDVRCLCASCCSPSGGARAARGPSGSGKAASSSAQEHRGSATHAPRGGGDVAQRKPPAPEPRTGAVHEAQIAMWSDGVALVSAASRHRSSAATACNHSSSRSHLVVRVILRKVTSQDVAAGSSFVVMDRPHATVTIVDLAGNENVRESRVSAAELVEARHVNASLAALADVMAALVRRDPFVPYRNHVLTRLLEPGVTGNARVLVIVNVTALPTHREHTLQSLRCVI